MNDEWDFHNQKRRDFFFSLTEEQRSLLKSLFNECGRWDFERYDELQNHIKKLIKNNNYE